MLSLYFDLLERAHAADIGAVRGENLRMRLRNKAFDMSDRLFIKMFRLSKDLTRTLILELTPHLPNTRRTDGIDVSTKVLVALGFVATGSYQTLVGHCSNLCVSQPTVSRVVQQVIDALNKPEVLDNHIMFPFDREPRERIKREFYEKYQMPGVLGCVDGTHVAIIRPLLHEERFFNRKGYHSLNVLIICDSNLQIMCVDSSYPGSTHDSTVWQSHPLKAHIEDLQITSGEEMYFLGDSGYPLRRTMMTPILHTAPRTPEAHYTELHLSARNVVERCIGTLKARFRCLLAARALHYNPTTAAKIVNACCVLHNIAHGANIAVPELTEEERVEEVRLTRGASPVNDGRALVLGNDLQQGRAFRCALVERLWRERAN